MSTFASTITISTCGCSLVPITIKESMGGATAWPAWARARAWLLSYLVELWSLRFLVMKYFLFSGVVCLVQQPVCLGWRRRRKWLGCDPTHLFFWSTITFFCYKRLLFSFGGLLVVQYSFHPTIHLSWIPFPTSTHANVMKSI
jgi:hypothetical protein